MITPEQQAERDGMHRRTLEREASRRQSVQARKAQSVQHIVFEAGPIVIDTKVQNIP